MNFEAQTLQSHARVAVYEACLDLLRDARTEARRLGNASDREALHDFRVALRRFRSFIQAYRPWLGGRLSRKKYRGIRDLMRSTNESRDAEVLLDWIRQLNEGIPESERQATKQFQSTLEAETKHLPNLEQTARSFFELADKFENKLKTCKVSLGSPTFAEVTRTLVDKQSAELRATLSSIQSIGDIDAQHEARIEGKKLRYLLEPLRAVVDDAKPLVEQLRQLQDCLGNLHDLHLLIQRLGHEPSALRKACDAQIERDYQALETWQREESHAFFGRVARVSAKLGGYGPSSMEIERRYLLTSVPLRARSAPWLDMEQGYVPGKKLHERVRRTISSESGEHKYFRTIKTGRGASRIELEEETTPEIFAALWNLTHGARLKKRRYLVQEGDHRWEIDEFLDRDLVLTEIELTDADEAIVMPDWLGPYIVREVTDEPEYVNINLAR